MRCKHCDYPLWRIETRTCPECGEGFRPSEFEFRPGAVAFQCPHCRQSYYGTAADGHLVPEAFDCVQCGRSIHMDEMVLLPGEGHTEDSGSAPPNPWAERRRIGFLRAWWRTVRGVLATPERFALSLSRDERLIEPFFLFCFTWGAAMVLGIIVSATSVFLRSSIMGNVTAWAIIEDVLLTFIVFVLWMALLVFMSLGSHVMLRITGGANEGWRVSFRAMLYALGGTSALHILACVPCINMVGTIWWIVSASIMLRTVQRIGMGRAVAAVLVPFGAVTVPLLVGAIALIVAEGMLLGPSSSAPTAPVPVAAAATLSGAWPRTPLDALADGTMDGGDFLSMAVGDEEDILIEGLDRDALLFGDRDDVRRAADRLALRIPADGLYRLGELAITWRGVPLGDADAWIMIERFGPDEEGDLWYQVYQAGYTIEEFLDQPTFARRRGLENHRRSGRGQPRIPDFEMIPDLLFEE